MDRYGGGRNSEHVALTRRHYCFTFKILVEGEEEFPPRLQCLLDGDLAVTLGTIVWKGVGLDEGGCVNGCKKIVQEGEAGMHRLLLGVLECIEALWYVGFLLP